MERDRWLAWGLAKGELTVIDRLLTEAKHNLVPELADMLITSVEVALTTPHCVNEHNRAWAYRMRGVCLEAKGDGAAALASYEEALRLNPKAGVKRRADALRNAARPR